MECYVSKLNLEPTVLELYNEENLIQKVIPESLNKIFKMDSEKNGLIKYKVDNNIAQVKESDIYKQLLEVKQCLILQYEIVEEHFRKTGEIKYNKEYMSCRVRLKQYIDQLFLEYPFLRNAEDIKIPSFSKGKIPEIQMGVTYIDRVNKIEFFLLENLKLIREIVFFYDTSNERIYIPSYLIVGSDVVNELNLIISEIQDKINLFKNMYDLGKVSINIVYNGFKIVAGEYKEVTVIRVYPNGDPSIDRQKALMKAAKTETKYTASDGTGFLPVDIEDEVKEDAEKGYVSAVVVRGKNIIKNTIKKFFVEEN